MNRRFTTLTFGAIPVFALAALVNLDHIPGTNIALTVPYAAEGPGPMFNTLGKVNDVDVVQITGTDVDHTSGNLNMTTVSVRTNMTLVQAISRWLLTSDNLVPIDQVIPQNKTEEEVNQLNQQAFLSSESSATTAALRYLKKPLEVEIAEVVAGSSVVLGKRSIVGAMPKRLCAVKSRVMTLPLRFATRALPRKKPLLLPNIRAIKNCPSLVLA